MGSKATEENFKKIELDAPATKVVELVGEPDKKMKHPQFPSIEIWNYGESSHVSFDGGKVMSVSYNDEMLVEKELPDDE